MAQKQVIWSSYAKKKLYAILESIVKESEDTDQALLFFRLLSKKIDDLKKGQTSVYLTNSTGVEAVPVEHAILVFERRESGIIMHTVIKKR